MKNKSTTSSNSPIECGFSNINQIRIPFSFQFFLIIVLFLIFDIEISILTAFPIETKTTKKNNKYHCIPHDLNSRIICRMTRRKIKLNTMD